MPLHADFQKVKNKFASEYGAEKGEEVFYAWMNKHGYDDTKPMPSMKNFLFTGELEFKSEDGESYLEGVLSSTNPDLGNDIITESALMEMADQINSKAETTPIAVGYDHTEWKLGGKPSTVPIGKLFKAWVEDGKVFVKGSVNKALSVYKELKSAIDRKELNSYSIEYMPKSYKNEIINGVKHRIIDSLKLIGAGLTGRPMNSDAYANFYMKHIEEDILEESKTLKVEEKNKDQVKKTEVKAMAEEIKETAPIEKKEEVKTPQVDVQSLVREEVEKKIATMQVKNQPKLNDEPKFPEVKSQETPLAKAIVEWKNVMFPSAKKVSYTPTGQIDISPAEQFKSAAKLHTQVCEARGVKDGLLGASGGFMAGRSFNVTGPALQDIQVKHVEFKAWSDGSGELREATNKVSDADYYQTAAELNDIYGPAVVNLLNDKTTTYGLLRKVDASTQYGDKYGFIVRYGRNSTAQNYAQGDISASSVADRQDRLKCQQPFMQYAVLVQVSGKMLADARGSGSSIGDVWSDETMFATGDLKKKINQQLFDTSTPSNGFTAGGQIMSFASIVSYDGTTGSDVSPYGHSQDAYTQLRCAYVLAAATTDITKQRLRTAVLKVEVQGAERRDLIWITGYTQRDKVLGLLDEHQRINNTSPRAGFEGLPTFDGIPIHADVDLESENAGYMYLIDTAHTFIIVQQAPVIEELAHNGDERRTMIKTYLNLVSDAPNHNAAITGLKTT